MKKIIHHIIICIFLLCYSATAFASDVISVNNLRCEMISNPIGIDVTTPRFSWQSHTGERGMKQLAYQIVVASSQNLLDKNEGDLWNSGKVMSDQSHLVSYAGKTLRSRQQCFWKVKVWANNGEESWSDEANFSIGLLNANDWKAAWIGLDRAFSWDSVSQFARLSARYFRKEIDASKQIKKATVYISGLGLYELYINGQKIGDQVLAPAPTDYSKTVLYNTFDVTSQVKQGRNAIATVLGNGRFFAMRQNYKPQKWHTFGFPKMLLQLEIEYSDGTKQIVGSDASWKVTADGPIRTNNEYDGEEYDATKELTGWNNKGYNDSKWLKVEMVKPPEGKLVAQMNGNMKVMETLKPVSIKQLSASKYILDIGQNIAGWLKMTVKGQKGQEVKLRFAESLQPNGELFVANLRDAKVTDIYTIKGKGQETWSPSFVYHGFRYVEISNYPGTPTMQNFLGEVVYDEMKTIGSFETSNNIINATYKNALWSIKDNYKGMPVDCPQRNERQPWLGDRATGAYGESFLFDNANLYAKWLNDIEESQTAEGSIPDVAPSFWYYYKDDVTWPGTYLMVADMLYRQFGDKASIVKHYSSMKKWMMYMKSKYMENYIITKDSYGDVSMPPESLEITHSKDPSRLTEPGLLSTATYYHLLQLLQKFTNLSDNNKDIEEFATLSGNIKEAFNKKFFNTQSKQYSNNTVTANILPLAFNMVPDDAVTDVFQHIVDKTIKEHGGHISTGVIGTQWLMRWLTKNGRADIAYKLSSDATYPSWGYMAANGATTIWERWNGNTAAPEFNSQNHVMLLGDLLIWMYENLGGIQSDVNETGFKKIVMKPSFIKELDYVKTSYESPYGKISSYWRKDKDELKWDITIPANTTALVYIPSVSEREVKENTELADKAKAVRFVRMEKENAVFEIGSGNYSFSVEHKVVVK